jgi:hypothetical protein
LGTRRFQHELVDHGLVLVDRAVDTVELLEREHVHRKPLLERGDARIVLRLERFEGAHEIVEGVRHVVARCARGGAARGGAARGGAARGLGLDRFSQLLFAHVIPLLVSDRQNLTMQLALPSPLEGEG